jgi:hypothetical protein
MTDVQSDVETKSGLTRDQIQSLWEWFVQQTTVWARRELLECRKLSIQELPTKVDEITEALADLKNWRNYVRD